MKTGITIVIWLIMSFLTCSIVLRADEFDKDDLKALQGKWEIVEVIDAGVNQDKVKGSYIFVGDKLTIAEGNEQEFEVTITLKSTEYPKHITATGSNDSNLPGIYEIRKDSLWICLNLPGMKRPERMVSRKSDKCRLILLKRSSNSDAQDEGLLSTMTAKKIETMMKGFSDVKNFKELANNQYIFEIDNFKVVLDNLENSLMLTAYFEGEVTNSRINEWNRTTRLSKAFLGKDNKAVLQVDIGLIGGVSREHVVVHMSYFVSQVKAFAKAISD
jgi:uncharacterized protein (TIGR03067 family)